MAFNLSGLLAIFGTPAGETIRGTSGNDVVYGNGGRDTLNGGVGDDTLVGGGDADLLNGGTGNDTMAGGAGDDTYIVDAAGDMVMENENAGTDTVRSSVAFALGAHLENLVLTGSQSINGTGNVLDNTLTGNTGSNILDGGAGADIMIGGRGHDTYVVDHTGDVVIEVAGEGTDRVVSSIDYVLGANVEHLTLTGAAVHGTGNGLANTIVGNELDNVLLGGDGNDTLTGGGGNDVLDGGAGNDRMAGGAGDDTYFVDSTLDVVTELPGEGTDQVFASASFTLGNHVESLTLTGAAAINGTGNSLANVITGNSAQNVLDGKAGADILTGGLGDDTYVVDNVGDVIVEHDGQGIDTVESSIDFVLADHFENLTLTGRALIGTGNTGDNVIRGNGQNNTLDGGLGADTLIGGTGNDTYVIDDADTVVEMPGEGVDTVVSANTYALGANVENLTLTGTLSINGTGNALGNRIIGNSGDNALSGGDSRDWLYGEDGNDTLDGGTGGDFMYGGAGDDTYIVDDVGDTVIEYGDSGTDTVVSSIHLALRNHFENLTLTGDANIDATGNSAANVLIGNAGNNRLDGKAGADTMRGGAGDDVYVVDNAGDTVTEYSGEGIDHVISSISFTLPDHVENLTFTGARLANGTGNDLHNTLIGNIRNNVLDGGGGADTMIGGAGNDTYIVDNAADTIVELFNEGIDTVFSSVSHSLSDNVERLTLTGTASISATGNSLANSLTGNSANNIIDGGAGADVMAGGAGDDTYFVDDAGDLVIEDADGGYDHVNSTVSIGSIEHVERLTLIGGSDADVAANALDNIITGNSGANIISGGDGKDTLMGGAGNDTLNGDAGDDLLFGQDGHDVLNGGRGTDMLNGGGGNDALDGGEGNDTLFGGGGQDKLFGGDGDDRIYGDGGNDIIRGGAGNDLMGGGQLNGAPSGGNDTFVWMREDIVDDHGNSAGFDTIVDFGIGDRLDFSGVFNGAQPAPIADLVRITEVDAGSIVAIDVNANGQFFDVAILSGVQQIDVDDLIGQSSIIV